MKIDTDKFSVPPGKKVRLKHWPTRVKPFYDSEKDYEKILHSDVKELNALQGMLYAHNRCSLLVIFQAMDAAGKDGAIKHVMSGVNPQGCEVTSFKQPSAGELAHDFLWRTTCRLPERGHIGIFNRSYYEEVLIARVHPDVLGRELLPEETLKDKHIWKHRFQSIADFEKHLHRNGTRVIKFFLHISKAEQKKRFLRRIDDPDRNWKFSQADLRERGLWKEYMRAYEECLSATSTEECPWHVIPADDKENARLMISATIARVLKGMKLRPPDSNQMRQKELQKTRKLLLKD
ncbi:MAG TPA: ADP-polyphosphate phosphotransferase [Verrucomicrobiae bacterium]|jgi:PPK2 family polyphosphate:nucleotide phosphotransferase